MIKHEDFPIYADAAILCQGLSPQGLRSPWNVQILSMRLSLSDTFFLHEQLRISTLKPPGTHTRRRGNETAAPIFETLTRTKLQVLSQTGKFGKPPLARGKSSRLTRAQRRGKHRAGLFSLFPAQWNALKTRACIRDLRLSLAILKPSLFVSH